MTDPRDFVFTLDPRRRPAPSRPPERPVAEIGWYNANRASTRMANPVSGIEGIVIHATAGASSAGALGWWKDARGQASAHWIVPGEQEPAHGDHVLATVYEALAAWHVRNDRGDVRINGGRARINHWTLGIEIVNTQSMAVPDPYSDWQIEATAALVRYAWARYPNLKWVFSHAAVDPGRRSDPGTNFPWARFEALVKAKDGPAYAGAMAVMPAVGIATMVGRPCCM